VLTNRVMRWLSSVSAAEAARATLEDLPGQGRNDSPPQ